MHKILNVTLLLITCLTIASCADDRETKELNLTFNVDTSQGQVNKKAIEQTKEVLAKRFDQLGIDNPEIIIDEKTGRLNLKLKTKETPEYITKLVCTKGDFGIWETYGNQEFAPILQNANGELAKMVANGHPIKNDLPVQEDSMATKFGQENPLYVVLSPNVYQDDMGLSVYAPGSGIGIAREKNMPLADKMLKLNEADIIIPQDAKFMWAAKPARDMDGLYLLYAVKTNISGQPAIESGSVEDATIETDDDFEGYYKIELQFKPDVIALWERLTRNNAQKCLAIVMDNKVYSCPTVMGPITNGKSEITGSMNKEEAQLLAIIMKTGQLGLSYSPGK
jgi:SecD/SecF fusion protein